MSSDASISTLNMSLRSFQYIPVGMLKATRLNLCNRKSREFLARKKTFGRIQRSLDIRRLVSKSISYKALVKSLLTPHQQIMLKNQRTQKATFLSEDQTSSVTQDEKWSRPSLVVKQLSSFHAQTDFDKRLYEGMLLRSRNTNDIDISTLATIQLSENDTMTQFRRRTRLIVPQDQIRVKNL